MESFNKNQLFLWGGVIIIIIFIGWFMLQGSSDPNTTAVEESAVVLPEEAAVIDDIAESTETATLKNSIPTVAPSTNPIENIYNNPFE